MSESMLKEIRREIEGRSDPENADNMKRYFREYSGFGQEIPGA